MICPQEYSVAGWLPEGKSGNWSVERFTVPPYPDAVIPKGVTPGGVYTRLVGPTAPGFSGDQWMSDQPCEFDATLEFCEAAHGDVLILGLGLGIVPAWLLKTNPRVDSITIVELNVDVITLVASHLQRHVSGLLKPLRIWRGDASAPRTRERFDVALHDYWQGSPGDERIDTSFRNWSPFVEKQFAWTGSGLPMRNC